MGEFMEKIDCTNLTKEDFVKEQRLRDEIFSNVSNSIGVKNFDDDYIQIQINNLFEWMNKFYDCSIEMFRGLGEVYEFNSDFTDILVKNYGDKMPEFLRKAIYYFCDNRTSK